MAEPPGFGEPLWWVRRLEQKLRNRRESLAMYDDYYAGRHPLAFASEKFLLAFGGLFEAFADNWCGVVVDAERERLHVEGFRFGDDPKADKDAWAHWQRNNMDLESEIGHTEALVHGEAAVTVWADTDGQPLITVEHPKEMIVEDVAGNRRKRAAALKVFTDDMGVECCTLYLPGGIWKYARPQKGELVPSYASAADSFGNQWVPRIEPGESWPLANPLKVVPVVALLNRPRLLVRCTSEMTDVVPLQNGVNKLLADMLVASEYGAFRQRWVTGMDTLVDPETNQPIEPFHPDVSHLWVGENPETKFGDLATTDLQNFVTGIELIVKHIATQSRTPQHYFSQSGPPPSGEGIKSMEVGLVSKCMTQSKPFGDTWEEVERLCFAVEGDKRGGQWDAETIWGDMESRSESEHVDATLKKQALNIPDQQLWEDLGYSPQQIGRFKQMHADAQLRSVMAGGPQFGAPVAVPPGRLPPRMVAPT